MEQNLSDVLNNAVQSVMNNVLNKLPHDETVQGSIALCTAFVVSPKTVRKTLFETFGESLEFVLFEEGIFNSFGFKTFNVQSKEQEAQLMQKTASAANIILVAPKVSLLERIASGEDEATVEHLVIRSLLWGRNVYLLLDFDRPRFKRGTFYEKIGDVLDTLTDMGIKIILYTPTGEQEDERYSLVTQIEVEDASKRGKSTVRCTCNAIVTPLAHERARELGISIES